MPAPFKWLADFTITPSTTADRTIPTLIATQTGRFDVLYTRGFTSDTDPYTTRYSAGGSLLTQYNFEGSVSINGANLRGAETSDGRRVFVWTEAPAAGGGDLRDVYYAVQYPDGSMDTIRTLLSGGAGEQLDPVVATSENGGWAIAWVDASGAEAKVVVRTFNAAGATGATIDPVNTTLGVYNFANEPQISITAMSDGNYFVAWADGSPFDIRGQIISSSGSAVGGEISVDVGADTTAFPTVTALDSGYVMISWVTTTGELYGQIRTTTGGIWTSAQQLATGVGISGASYQHDIAALPGGRFVAVWTTSSGEVVGRMFNNDSTPTADGAIFQIATDTTGTQYRPQVEALADGRFVVTWESDNGAGLQESRATIFDPRETGVNMAGTGFGDDMYGTSFNDAFYVGAGDDTVRGQGGADYIVGEGGNDSLLGGDATDLLYGGGEADNLQGENGDDYVYGGTGADTLSGGAGNDIVYGELGNDFVAGDTNNDTLIGGDGHDSLYGGDGDDSLDGSGGFDTIYGGAGNDFMRGGSEDSLIDTLIGEAGNDQIYGEGGGDSIDAGADNDTVYGGSGNDTIQGGTGLDVLIGESGSDTIYGGDDADSIDGGSEGDTLYGEAGNDFIQGQDGDDFLDGGANTDDLRGGNGNDTIIGGAGGDTMYGNAGNDVFRFAVGSGADAIVGWEDGLDRIDISTYAGATFANTVITQVGGDTRVTFVSGDSVLLIGVSAATITIADFIT